MIEEYKEQYLNEVLKVWLDTSILAHNFIPASYWESKMDDMKNIYIPASNTFVYLDDTSNVIGFISLVENYIAAIFVAPAQQGKGIGKLLISRAKELHQSLELSVYKENDSSVQFYQKQGFVISEEKTEQHTGHQELIMKYENQ